MGLLTQDDVATIQGNLKDAEAAMKSAQAALDKNQDELKGSFDKLNDTGNKISATEKIINDAADIIAANEAKIADSKLQLKDYDGQLAAAESAGDDAEVKRLLQLIDALKVEIDTLSKEIDNQSIVSADAKVSMDNFQLSYDETKTTISELQAEQVSIKAELALHTENFNEYSNSTILAQFENEKKTRKEIASKAVKNKERIKPLIKNTNEGLDNEMEEFVSDTNIFITDIKSELGIDTVAEETIKAAIADLNADYEKKGTEGVFMAADALQLSRKSLFDLELAGINKLIKAACYKGETSIKIAEHEITGTQIVALNEGGYKVSHEKVDERAKNTPEVMIVIDWGFVLK